MIDREVIIFLHMFKTGGTTVTNKIADNYGPERWAIGNTSLNNARHPCKMNRPGLVSGHGIFGIHRYLQQPSIYVTFLRDPVERLVSAYSNIREPRCSGHPLHEFCANNSFLDFIRSDIPHCKLQVDNYQVRELTGQASMDFREFDMCNVDLDRAIWNLDSFFGWVGMSEDINTDMDAMKKKFKWTKGPPEDLCMNKSVNRLTDIPDEVIQEVQNKNTLDYKLIDWMKSNRESINLRLLGESNA